MSSNKTKHLALHAWEPEDMFTREEFNANFAAIDGEAGALRAAVAAAQAAADAAQAAANTARSAASAAQSTADGSSRIQIGSYTGTGATTSSSKKITINFDFRPQVVFLFTNMENTSSFTLQADHAGDFPTMQPVLIFSRTFTLVKAPYSTRTYYDTYCTWGEKSLSFYSYCSTYTVTAVDCFNKLDTVYHWIAIG